jgi:hypothetical protein
LERDSPSACALCASAGQASGSFMITDTYITKEQHGLFVVWNVGWRV